MNSRANKKGNETRKKIYTYIKAYILQNGYPPSFREVGEATGLKSSNTLYNQMRKLKEMGVYILKKERIKER